MSSFLSTLDILIPKTVFFAKIEMQSPSSFPSCSNCNLIRLFTLILQGSIHNENFFLFFLKFFKSSVTHDVQKTTIGIQQQATREGLPVY